MANYVPIIVLSLFVATEAQSPPKCVTDMMTNPNSIQCIQGFMAFIRQAAEGSDPAGGDGDQGAATIQLMCSPEGQAYIKCLLPFIGSCPEIQQQIGGMDLASFFAEDGPCKKMVSDPCSKIMKCIKDDSPPQPEGNKSSNIDPSMDPHMDHNMDPNSMKHNPFAAFLMESSITCGRMKSQWDCVMSFEDECGDHDQVREMKMESKTAIEGQLKISETAIAGFDELIKFMNEECSKMPTEKKSCVMGALSSTEFLNCYQNATDTYTIENEGKCGLFDTQSVCLEKAIGKCGEEETKFMQRNMNLVLKKVPESCTLTGTDTSGAISNVQLAATTLVMLTVSAFIAV